MTLPKIVGLEKRGRDYFGNYEGKGFECRYAGRNKKTLETKEYKDFVVKGPYYDLYIEDQLVAKNINSVGYRPEDPDMLAIALFNFIIEKMDWKEVKERAWNIC